MITALQIDNAAWEARHLWEHQPGKSIHLGFVEAVKAGVALAQAGDPSIAPRITSVTAPQRQLLVFITAFIDRHGYSPTFEEMAAGIGLASKSRVASLLERLVERGAIRRRKHQSRGIELLARPVDVTGEARR